MPTQFPDEPFTITLGEGVAEIIYAWVQEALNAGVDEARAAKNYEELVHVLQDANDVQANLLSMLAEKLFKPNDHDGNLGIYRDAYTELLLNWSYDSGYCGGFLRDKVKPKWSSHT